MTRCWANPWSIAEPRALARFVPIAPPFIDIPSTNIGLCERAKWLYEKFSEEHWVYVNELWSPDSPTQYIRHPDQIARDRQGTCVDLALYYCAACREARILSWLVILEGHVLVMLCVVYSWDEYNKNVNGRGGDRNLFKDGQLTDITKVRRRLEEKRFIAVECTGFAVVGGGNEPAYGNPKRNEQGLLSFNDALDSAKELLCADSQETPRFRAAIDLAVAFEDHKIQEEELRSEESWFWKAWRNNRGLRSKLASNPLTIRRRPDVTIPKKLLVDEIFPLEIKLNNNHIEFSSEYLLDWLVENEVRFAVLTGGAGSGKSDMLAWLAKRDTGTSTYWILLNLKRFAEARRNQLLNSFTAPDSGLSDRVKALGELSVAPLKGQTDLLEFIDATNPTVLLVDGLNEVPDLESRISVLDALKWLLSRCPGMRVIVSTRESSRSWATNWASLPSVEGALAFVKVCCDSFIDKPFFVDRQPSDGLKSSPSSELVFDFLKHQLVLEVQQINSLSRVAYELYVRDRALTFSKDSFIEHLPKEDKGDVGNSLWARLTESSLIIPSGDGELKSYQFEHQIIQDYLAARYLALPPAPADAPWSVDVFDAVTFKAASTEVLVMALEQVRDPKAGDRFLERVYNWSWRHAFTCMSVAAYEAGNGEQRWSAEVEEALSALRDEKLSDRVLKTRMEAKKIADRAPFVSNNARLSSTNIIPRWYERWQKVFDQSPKKAPVEPGCLGMIVDSNSIVGWTVANVLRRFEEGEDNRLSQRDLAVLRGIYEARDRRNEFEDAAIRWRIVHVLGVFPSEPNFQLLLRAFCDASEDKWVRYGSARSLIENAVRATKRKRSALLKRIIEACKESRPPEWILLELGQTAFYRAADEEWVKQICPMLKKIRDGCESANNNDRDLWDRLLANLSRDEAEWRGIRAIAGESVT